MGKNLREIIEAFEQEVDGPKPSVLSELLSTRLKTEISRILLDALSGSDRSLRIDDGFIKWGLVERKIHKAIDEACS